ncbi:MAG: hypothetical protein ABL890_00630 [Candidatus Peribacteraceae bacterium]
MSERSASFNSAWRVIVGVLLGFILGIVLFQGANIPTVQPNLSAQAGATGGTGGSGGCGDFTGGACSDTCSTSGDVCEHQIDELGFDVCVCVGTRSSASAAPCCDEATMQCITANTNGEDPPNP